MQDTGLNRNIIDKYYTKNNIVELCIEYIKKHINILENDLIIEPSAGNGAFIQSIKNISQNYKFIDIKPEHNEILETDFLDYSYNFDKSKYDNIHIIGNPPFGRQSSNTIKFIKHCCKFANSISFILPKSFKKDSMQKYFKLNYHLIYQCDLPDNAFLVNNIEYNVPCIFQIWIYKNYNRPVKEKLEPINYKFVKKTEDPDISFRRVGVYAGKIDKDINKSIQSHYFIKFKNDLTIDENINKIKNIKFTEKNTVGARSISKQELIEKFNELLI